MLCDVPQYYTKIEMNAIAQHTSDWKVTETNLGLMKNAAI